MLPIRHSSIFRSRWWALLWAAGICWSAIAFVTPSPDDDAAANTTNAAAPDVAAGDDASVKRLQLLVGQLQHSR